VPNLPFGFQLGIISIPCQRYNQIHGQLIIISEASA